MIAKKICNLVVAVLLTMCSGQTRAVCSPWLAKILSFEGIVEKQFFQKLDWQLASNNDLFCPGDRVRVAKNSRLVLMLGDETRVNLAEKTTLTFVQPNRKQNPWIIDLIRGKAFFRSRERRKLNILTPFINAVHKGTEFLVEVDNEETLIRVFDGKVSAENELGQIMIDEGFQGRAQSGQAPKLESLTIKPVDAVQWTLYYPGILNVSEFVADKSANLKSVAEIYQQHGAYSALNALNNLNQDQLTTDYWLLHAYFLISLGSIEQAEYSLNQVLQWQKDNALAYALKSILAVSKNQSQSALQWAEQAVLLDKQSTASYLALSYAHQSMRNLEKALDATEHAFRISPENALVLTRLAELQLASGQYSQALVNAKKAQQLNPEYDHVQIILGFASLMNGNRDEAVHVFSAAIQLDSANPVSHLGLGLAKIRQGDVQQGVTDLENAVSLDSENAIMRSYLGKAYYEIKNEILAETELDLGKEKDPNDPTPWFYSAILKQTTNRPVEALQDMHQAIELNDNRGVYRSDLLLDEDLAARSASLGRIYNDLGFQQLGLVEGWKSVSEDPGNYSAHRLLADNYAALPRHEKARASSLLQSQLLQPVNITPIQPRLAESDRLASTTLGSPSFNEYNSLFQKNQFTVQGSGVIGNNDAYGGELVHAGIWNDLSYSLGLYHFEDDGIRENNHIRQDIANAFVQYRVNEQLNVQFEYRYNELDNGDLRQRFDASSFQASLSENYSRNYARIGATVKPSNTTTLLFSGLYLHEDFNALTTSPLFQTEEEAETFSFEMQLIQHFLNSHVVFGGGFSHLDQLTTTHSAINASIPFTPLSTIIETNTISDFEQDKVNAYLYLFSEFNDFKTILGVSFDSIASHTNPDNHKFNPKAGIIWNLTDSTVLRLAYFQSLVSERRGSQTIEPTQIAGFVQLMDEEFGTEVEQYGIGLDHKFIRELFMGLEASVRHSVKYTYSFPENSLINFLIPVNRFDLKPDEVFDEETNELFIRNYWNWTPYNELALGLEYNFTISDTQLSPGSDPGALKPLDIFTHRVPLFANIYLPNGFFAKFKATYINQHVNSLLATNKGSDQFWSLDATLGFRLPDRMGRIELVGRNLLDENYQYSDRNVITGLPTSPSFESEREVSLQFIFDLGL